MSMTDPLFRHHKHCDEIFARAEEAVSEGAWVDAEEAFTSLRTELETHFKSEEDLLFPAFEQRTGMTSGPTQVMRVEHGQMRELLDEMQRGLGARDAEIFAGAAEILLVLMQQHNMKEENILYPMCDDAIRDPDVGDAIAQRLAEPCHA